MSAPNDCPTGAPCPICGLNIETTLNRQFAYDKPLFLPRKRQDEVQDAFGEYTLQEAIGMMCKVCGPHACFAAGMQYPCEKSANFECECNELPFADKQAARAYSQRKRQHQEALQREYEEGQREQQKLLQKKA